MRPMSPDLGAIENCFRPMKDYLRKVITDEETLIRLMIEEWEHTSQEYISEQMLSTPQRMKDCIQAEGFITGW